MVNHETTPSITSLPTTQIHLIHITQMMLYQINQHPNIVHTQVSHPKTTTLTSLVTLHILLILQMQHPKYHLLMKNTFHPYRHHASIVTQMKSLIYLNKKTLQTRIHIHLTHFYQMTLLRNILNLKTTTIPLINTWTLCFMSKPQYKTITQHLHHHHHPNMKSSLKSSKKLMS